MDRYLMSSLAFMASITMASAKDLSPDVWISQATCQDVMELMAAPLSYTGADNPLSSAGYVGAVMGFVEGVRSASYPDREASELRSASFKACQKNPDVKFSSMLLSQ